MAIAVENANAGTAVNDASATTIAVVTTATVAAGALIVASLGWWLASAATVTVAGGSLTWATAVQGKNASGEQQAGIAYALAPSGLASGATITATYSAAVNGRQIGVSSFTGVDSGTPLGNTGAINAGNLVAAWATASVAISAGSVLVGVSHLDPNGTSTITAPSIEALDWTDGANTAATMGYRIEASAASYTVAGAWSISSSRNATVGAEFKAAAAGGGTTVKKLAALGVG